MFDKLMKGFGLVEPEDERKNVVFEVHCRHCFRILRKEESIANHSGSVCGARHNEVEKGDIRLVEAFSDNTCTKTLVDGKNVYKYFTKQISEVKSKLKYKTPEKTYSSMQEYYKEKQEIRLKEDKDKIFESLRKLLIVSKRNPHEAVQKSCILEIARIINNLATSDLEYHDEILKDKRIEQAVSSFQEVYPKMLKYKYKHINLFSLEKK